VPFQKSLNSEDAGKLCNNNLRLWLDVLHWSPGFLVNLVLAGRLLR